jgi:RimJ/RimL family protein N-acetyltransferase
MTEDHAESWLVAVNSIRDEHDYLFCTRRFTLQQTQHFMQTMREKGYPALLALGESGQVLGWCDISPGNIEETAHVGTLGMGVIKTERGKGLGNELLARCIIESRRFGLEKIELEVFAANTPARALYRKHGFVDEGILKRKRKFMGHYDDLVCMGLFL